MLPNFMRFRDLSGGLLLVLIFAIVLESCKDDAPDPVVPVVVNFQNKSVSVNESKADGEIVTIALQGPATRDQNVKVSISDHTTSYGNDYVTEPAAVGGMITLHVAKGATNASFKIVPKVNSAFDGDKDVTFFLTGTDSVSVVGNAESWATIVDDDLVFFLPMLASIADNSHFSNQILEGSGSFVPGTTGKPATAYHLNGYSDRIIAKNASALDKIEKITLAAWVKPESFYGNGNNGILEKPYQTHSGPTYQYKLGLTGDEYPNTTATFNFALSLNLQYKVVVSPATWVAGQWYFVVATYDGAAMSIYVNGELSISQPATGVINQFGQNLVIGETYNISSYTPGSFGEMRIYNRALSAAEIKALYQR